MRFVRKLTSQNLPSIGIIGSGSWATALTKIITDSGHHVHWYVHNPSSIKYLLEHHSNPKYLRGVKFKMELLTLSADINEVVRHSQWLILATPSLYIEQALQKINSPISNKIIFSATKGMVPESQRLVGDHLFHHYGVGRRQLGTITGPCHAEEIALERLSYLTLSSNQRKITRIASAFLACDYVKTVRSSDRVGTEYAALLKNIYALAAGIANGLDYGDNFQSVLISNSLREMDYFIRKIRKRPSPITHSAYLGDLLVTAYSPYSRNRKLGVLIGKGLSVEAAKLEMKMVAEGYYACNFAYAIRLKKMMKTPILDAVYTILYQGAAAKKVLLNLAQKLT
mgnify:FL=1